MKSRTSSCKSVALFKDLSRFFPVWVGFLLCLTVLQMVQSLDEMTYWYAANLAECISLMGLVNFVFGLVVAQMLFGDLFNIRLCNGIHALPLKREQWFGVHLTAGFLFSLIPTALMTVFAEVMIFRHSTMINGWQVPLYWFAGSNLQYLFFFALAVFCAMCTGNRFAMLVVYGIVNFFSILLYLLVDQIYTPLLYGVVTLSDMFELFCPVHQLVGTRFLDPERTATGKTYIDHQGIEQREYISSFTVQQESWIYLGILAVLGIVLLLIARQMYKNRRLECAGDFMAVRWLEPVFQVVFTVLCAAGFHAMFYVFFGSGGNAYLLMGIGLVAGWFAGRMFLERTTKVFRLKNIVGIVLLAAVLALSLFVTKMDPLNVTGWVPGQENLQQATLSISHRGNYVTEDPQEIADLLRLHELALEERTQVHPDYSSDVYNPNDADPEAAYVSLHYKLDNGMRAYREYYVLAEGEAGQIARRYASRIEVVASTTMVKDAQDFRYAMGRVNRISVSGKTIHEKYITEEFVSELTEAILADCEAGNMVQSGVYHPEPIFSAGEENYKIRDLYLDMNGPNFFCYLNVYSDCENTLAVLEKTGVIEQVQLEFEYGIG